MPDNLDILLSCLHFATPIPKQDFTPYERMWVKIDAMSNEDIKSIWDSMQYCLRKGTDSAGRLLFDRSEYWDLGKTITLADWEEAIYSAMGQRGISAV